MTEKNDSGADAAAVEGAGSIDSPTATARHTPAPWTVRRSTGVIGGEVERWAIDGPPQGLAGRWWIATAMSDEPIDEANAHLIAAAPELLKYAALEQAIYDFDCPHDAEARCDCAKRHNAMIDRANRLRESAIAKAEGR